MKITNVVKIWYEHWNGYQNEYNEPSVRYYETLAWTNLMKTVFLRISNILLLWIFINPSNQEVTRGTIVKDKSRGML